MNLITGEAADDFFGGEVPPAVRTLLHQAALQACIDDLGEPLVEGMPVDYLGTGPARFWLFTQKALAFIALRAGRNAEARERLNVIARLAPDARLGDDVTARLAASAGDGDAPAGA